MLCDYGCGQEALYQLKFSKRWCCSPHYQQCPARRLAARAKTLEPATQGKSRATAQKNWGSKHYMQSEAGRRLHEAGVQSTLGVANISQAPTVKAKKTASALARYGVDNVSKAPEVVEQIRATLISHFGPVGLGHPCVLEKRRQTCQHRYGVSNPQQVEATQIKAQQTMLQRYGVRHGMQCAAIRSKAEHTRKLLKPVTLPSGRVVWLRGYEGMAVDLLLRGGIREEELVLTPKDIPSIPYTDPITGRHRVYHPDIYIPHLNYLIEVKSLWTFLGKTDELGLTSEWYAVNKAKEQAVKQHGYSFSFMILGRHGEPWGSHPHCEPLQPDTQGLIPSPESKTDCSS